MPQHIQYYSTARFDGAGAFPDPIMDNFSHTAYGAYSTARKLYGAATSAFRLRRDSDNAETDIGFSGNLIDTTAITSHLGGANGFIVRLYDQSTAGVTLFTFASDSTRQPQLLLNGGIYMAFFDGSNDKLQSTTNPLKSQPTEYFSVRDGQTAGSVVRNFGGNSTISDRHETFIQSGTLRAYAGVVLNSSITHPHGMTQIHVVFNGTSSVVNQLGVNKASGNAGTHTTNGTTLGHYYSTTTGDHYKGYWAEFIITGAVSAANRTNIKNSQQTFYSL